jgi:hypothetical protein
MDNGATAFRGAGWNRQINIGIAPIPSVRTIFRNLPLTGSQNTSVMKAERKLCC